MSDLRWWTKEEIETMKGMLRVHHVSVIGTRLGRTTASVRHKAERMGLKFTVEAPERVTAPVVRSKPNQDYEIVGRLEYCPTCRCPVSNWAEHTARLGHKRTA